MSIDLDVEEFAALMREKRGECISSPPSDNPATWLSDWLRATAGQLDTYMVTEVMRTLITLFSQVGTVLAFSVDGSAVALDLRYGSEVVHVMVEKPQHRLRVWTKHTGMVGNLSEFVAWAEKQWGP